MARRPSYPTSAQHPSLAGGVVKISILHVKEANVFFKEVPASSRIKQTKGQGNWWRYPECKQVGTCLATNSSMYNRFYSPTNHWTQYGTQLEEEINGGPFLKRNLLPITFSPFKITYRWEGAGYILPRTVQGRKNIALRKQDNG